MFLQTVCGLRGNPEKKNIRQRRNKKESRNSLPGLRAAIESLECLVVQVRKTGAPHGRAVGNRAEVNVAADTNGRKVTEDRLHQMIRGMTLGPDSGVYAWGGLEINLQDFQN